MLMNIIMFAGIGMVSIIGMSALDALRDFTSSIEEELGAM